MYFAQPFDEEDEKKETLKKYLEDEDTEEEKEEYKSFTFRNNDFNSSRSQSHDKSLEKNKEIDYNQLLKLDLVYHSQDTIAENEASNELDKLSPTLFKAATSQVSSRKSNSMSNSVLDFKSALKQHEISVIENEEC